MFSDNKLHLFSRSVDQSSNLPAYCLDFGGQRLRSQSPHVRLILVVIVMSQEHLEEIS